ncbi:phage-like protein [Xanthomonas fragariae]|uniref:Phage-like protein n=1 Tax=Xanthomonas fragariae TaxID=48664 RepID=A0A1Y6HAH5_9XANT|nr:A coat protein [Xanthomonas fragariae]AOD14955.1 A coat protein [Xanthomonas fragariae]AOD18351.1 A coat protein [Xanthomonas fragariae]MBL9195624.1 A coat protein [Xanthomonas fragariae]MBL9220867.1 A coat protein [Xanthomonas fragariae]SMQ99280.1 hypothetical protein PD885_02036 [Xanthomonas fragariae]
MRWLGRYFARTVVRRVVYLLVALIFAALGIGGARAANYGDQGIANAVCQAHLAAAQARVQSENSERGDQYWKVAFACVIDPSQAGNYTYLCTVNNGAGGCAAFAKNFAPPQGGAYDYSFNSNETCAARNSTKLADAALGYSAPSTCVGGCQVQGTPFSSAQGPVTVYGIKERTYNGQVCTPQKPTQDIGQAEDDKKDATQPKSPECTSLGAGQTACVKPNGDYCATASTGKTFCWGPAETGKKTEGSDAQTRTPKGEAVTPPNVPPADGEWQRKEGHQQTTCTNGSCNTNNVTNYSSVPGGTSKNSSGDNSQDGSGNTSGNGFESGSGDKENESKDSATDSGNCTTPPVCIGDTLKCLHLKFTWKTQCNTERGEVTGGTTCSDGDVPMCAGKSCKAAEYTQVLQSWRTRCGIDKDRDAAKSDAARGAADAAGDDEKGEVAKLWASDGKPGPHFDQNRLSIGGGDLLGGNIDIMGTSFTLNAQFYDALAIIKKIIIASAMVAAFVILWRS